jgi:hypothetical protein
MDPVPSSTSAIHTVPNPVGTGTTTSSTSIQPPPMPTGASGPALDDVKPTNSASESRFGNAAGANDVVITSSSNAQAPSPSAPVENPPVVNPGKGD